jgi:hypothetical protein
MKLMRAFFFVMVTLIYTSFIYSDEERVIIPFENGVTNYTYSKPFWLVSPIVMTDLLSAKAITTNFIIKETKYEKIIEALTANTNMDAKYVSFLEVKLKDTQKQLNSERGKIVIFTVGGFTIGLGLTVLVYHIAGNHIKEIMK